MKKLNLFVTALFGLAFLAACTPPASSMKKLLEENPDIVFNVIEKHPAKFFEVVKSAGEKAREGDQKEQMIRELERVKKDWENPKDVTFDENRAYGGGADAAVTIVEYSDYNCGHCSSAHDTVKGLKEKYGDKVRFVFKHLPILAKSSRTAAEYMEAIRIQDKDKAYAFHDEIFANQGDLRQGGEEFLKNTAKKVGADMGRLAKDVKGSAVKKIIEDDIKQARSFDFSGTPGFMINGAALPGAYPADFFEMAIDYLLENKK